MNWQELEKQVYMGTFSRLPVVFVRGDGARLYDELGKPYLDLVAGIAVNLLGYGHPAVRRAIHEQVDELMHTSNLYYTTPPLRLAKFLVDHSCGDRVFFVNSGAEANETAIKVARKYGKLHLNGAFEIITADHSFHGRTLGALALTAQPKYQEAFAPMPPGFKYVPFNDTAALRAAVNERTAAILLEPVQGESGVRIHDPGYMRAAREICDQTGALLMCDEVQTGLGRTGKFWGYENYGIEPDVLSIGKGLGGGLPLGGIIVKEKANVLTPGDHGSTMGGNPVACAAGLATLTTIESEGLVENAAAMGTAMQDGFKMLMEKHDTIKAVRGMGLMVAVDLHTTNAADLVKAALGKGLIINNTSPETLRMVPPLILARSDVDEAVGIVDQALAENKAPAAAHG